MPKNVGMENLIHIINKIHDSFAISSIPCTIDLPQIVVVGCQSAGKSSVLENIVGKEFLPRGSGIVTRRPLVLQLVTSSEEYGKFLHSQKTFYDFNEIRNEIQQETNRTCGKEKTVSNVSINLKIYSPDVITLTLVDLPGLTKLAVGGQSDEIVGLIREMVLNFIKKENSLILAVSPANTDLANSDALQIAKEVDPEGKRTIGVITKIDMMDAETNAREILENRVFPLQRGYVGVINRSQKEIEQKVPIDKALIKETEFFRNHNAYRHMADRMGTIFLQKYLNSQLYQHILHVLPSLDKAISDQLSILQPKVNEIESKDGKMSHKEIMTTVSKFSNMMKDSLISSSSSIDTKTLSVGAAINHCFYKDFPVKLGNLLKSDLEHLNNKIRISIQNVHGVKTGLNKPDIAFEMIVKMEIEKTSHALESCLDRVYSLVNSNVETFLNMLREYPNLKISVHSIIRNKMDSYYNETLEQLKLTVEIHKSYINTNHPDFIANIGKEDRKEYSFLKRGFVTVSNLSSNKNKGVPYYTVLSTENLVFYKDEDEKDKKISLIPDKLRYKLNQHQQNSISLFGNDEKSTLHKNMNYLQLEFHDSDEWSEWLSVFVEAGIKPYDPYNQTIFDLESATKAVRDYVESYKKVYEKIINDVVPKIIYYKFLRNFVDFLKEELIGELYSSDSIDNLSKQSSELIARNKEIVTLFKANKEAKAYIRDILNNISDISESIYIPKPAATNNPQNFTFNNSSITNPTTFSNISSTKNTFEANIKPPTIPSRSNNPHFPLPSSNVLKDSDRNPPSLPARPRR